MAVRHATGVGRLVVKRDVADDDVGRAAAIHEEVKRLVSEGQRSIGIYAKTNSNAADLSAALLGLGLDHVPIGFSESYGEALATMVAMVDYAAASATWGDVRTGLGTMLTASVRSSSAPLMATALHHGTKLPGQLDARLAGLSKALEQASNLGRAAEIAAGAWEAIGFAQGQRAWRRAGKVFVALARRSEMAGPDSGSHLGEAVARLRDASFVELDSGDSGAIQLMNFSQTKGREADACILSYTSDDWYGPKAMEPYDEPSRILYVSMTRARRTVVVMLPSHPHPLVRPFLQHAG